MTKIINLFGGPGIGKSGIAGELYGKMKANHLNVELVTEVAKDYVWEERFNILKRDQIYVFAKQYRRLDRLRMHQVDYVVTDCPILMCIAYIPVDAYYKTELSELMVTCAKSYDNYNIVLERNEETHTDVGRYHNLEESKHKDTEILAILKHTNEPFTKVPVNQDTVNTLYKQLIESK